MLHSKIATTAENLLDKIHEGTRGRTSRALADNLSDEEKEIYAAGMEGAFTMDLEDNPYAKKEGQDPARPDKGTKAYIWARGFRSMPRTGVGKAQVDLAHKNQVDDPKKYKDQVLTNIKKLASGNLSDYIQIEIVANSIFHDAKTAKALALDLFKQTTYDSVSGEDLNRYIDVEQFASKGDEFTHGATAYDNAQSVSMDNGDFDGAGSIFSYPVSRDPIETILRQEFDNKILPKIILEAYSLIRKSFPKAKRGPAVLTWMMYKDWQLYVDDPSYLEYYDLVHDFVVQHSKAKKLRPKDVDFRNYLQTLDVDSPKPDMTNYKWEQIHKFITDDLTDLLMNSPVSVYLEDIAGDLGIKLSTLRDNSRGEVEYGESYDDNSTRKPLDESTRALKRILGPKLLDRFIKGAVSGKVMVTARDLSKLVPLLIGIARTTNPKVYSRIRQVYKYGIPKGIKRKDEPFVLAPLLIKDMLDRNKMGIKIFNALVVGAFKPKR